MNPKPFKPLALCAFALMSLHLDAAAQNLRAEAKTGSPGSPAKVATRKSGKTTIFTFTIPRGARGPQGPQGEKGDPGDPGPLSSAIVTSAGPSALQAPLNRTPVIGFQSIGYDVELVRDGTNGGLKFLTKDFTSAAIVITATGVTYNANPTVAQVSKTVFIAKGTGPNVEFPLYTNAENMASVRIIVGNPSEQGSQAVIELLREAGQNTFHGSITTL